MSEVLSMMERIMEVTKRDVIHSTLRAVLGQYDADQWLHWMDSGAHDRAKREAIALNSRSVWRLGVRMNLVLSIKDKRTRGYKRFQQRRKEHDEQFEAEYPRPPQTELDGLKSLIAKNKW